MVTGGEQRRRHFLRGSNLLIFYTPQLPWPRQLRYPQAKPKIVTLLMVFIIMILFTIFPVQVDEEDEDEDDDEEEEKERL